jgi:soluble lytic murein transglycosylase-like protein
VKVPSPIVSKSIVRIAAACSLAWVLAVGGAAAPVTANAESAPAVSIASTPVSASPTVPGAETSPVVAPQPPAPVAPVAPAAKKLSIPALIAKIGHESGLSNAEVDTLLWIARRESNFHPRSESRSECHGLFQLSKGMAHGRPWKDPTWNTKRAIRYMKGRYGGIQNAKAFWLSHHWY